MLNAFQYNGVTVLKTGRNVVCKMAGYYAYCYVVGNTLIDTSTRYVEKEMLEYLQTVNLARIINTHFHEDHTGNNKAISDHFGIPIYASPQTVPGLQCDAPKRQRFYLKVMWGWPEKSVAVPLEPEFEFDGQRFVYIETPGHCDDHITIYNPEQRYAFTGDVFCGERVKYLRKDEDFSKQLQSIETLVALDIDTIFCSVAGVVKNANEALRRKLDFMLQLQEKVVSQSKQGKTPAQIRKEVLGGEGIMCWFSAGDFSKQNMVNSILQASAQA